MMRSWMHPGSEAQLADQNSSAGKRLFIAELATAQRDLEMLLDSVGPRCAPSKTPDFKLKNRTNVGIL